MSDVLTSEEIIRDEVLELLESNSKYWRKRFETYTNRYLVNHKTMNYYAIRNLYDKSISNIDKKLKEYYIYFDDLQLDYLDSKKFLDEDELDLFMDDIEGYLGDPSYLSLSESRELEGITTRKKISRLKAIKTQLEAEVEILTKKINEESTDYFGNVFENTYYRTLFEFDQGFHGFVGESFSLLNDYQIQAALSRPWQDTSFSERLWYNSNSKLRKQLTELITNATILGQNYKDTAEELSKAMNKNFNQCYAIISTESANVASLAQKECYNDLDCERYEIVATLDDRTSQQCQLLDGTIFPMSDFEPGVTAPPFHVHCRTSTAPYYDFGDLENLVEHKRAARIDGKTVWVDKMTYPEWAKKYGIEPIYGKVTPGNMGIIQNDRTHNLISINVGKNVPKDLPLTKYDYQNITHQLCEAGFYIENAIEYFPEAPDLSDFWFDDNHINFDHTRGITREQAVSFAENSFLKVIRENGDFVNYYSEEGACYIDMRDESIRTSFAKKDFDKTTKEVLKILETEGIK